MVILYTSIGFLILYFQIKLVARYGLKIREKMSGENWGESILITLLLNILLLGIGIIFYQYWDIILYPAIGFLLTLLIITLINNVSTLPIKSYVTNLRKSIKLKEAKPIEIFDWDQTSKEFDLELIRFDEKIQLHNKEMLKK